jgi:hypothetical protein
MNPGSVTEPELDGEADPPDAVGIECGAGARNGATLVQEVGRTDDCRTYR